MVRLPRCDWCGARVESGNAAVDRPAARPIPSPRYLARLLAREPLDLGANSGRRPVPPHRRSVWLEVSTPLDVDLDDDPAAGPPAAPLRDRAPLTGRPRRARPVRLTPGQARFSAGPTSSPPGSGPAVPGGSQALRRRADLRTLVGALRAGVERGSSWPPRRRLLLALSRPATCASLHPLRESAS